MGTFWILTTPEYDSRSCRAQHERDYAEFLVMPGKLSKQSLCRETLYRVSAD
jgi:hypothetical protein